MVVLACSISPIVELIRMVSSTKFVVSNSFHEPVESVVNNGVALKPLFAICSIPTAVGMVTDLS